MKRVISAFGILVCCNLNAQSPKTFATKTNALDNFTGYKVAANARQLGTEYWENTNLLSDIMICVFQKNYILSCSATSSIPQHCVRISLVIHYVI